MMFTDDDLMTCAKGFMEKQENIRLYSQRERDILRMP